MARYAMQTAMRAACVDFMEDYAAAASIKLQVYSARPRSIYPPTAFVDSLNETITYTALNQRQPTADVIVILVIFDSAVAADQRDAFVDGFIDWAMDNVHGAGANTTIAVTSVEDIPDFIPDWQPPQEQKTYYASRITLEGLSLSG
jgi:hypothetical protein